MWVAIKIAGILCFSAGCATDAFTRSDNAICYALHDLAAYAESENVGIEAVFIKSGGEIGCGYSPPLAVQQYCKVVLENSSMEFVNGYPWAIRNCLEKTGVVNSMKTTDDWSGIRGVRKAKIVAVNGEMNSGVNVSLVFEPDEKNNSGNYYGRYRLFLKPTPAEK